MMIRLSCAILRLFCVFSAGPVRGLYDRVATSLSVPAVPTSARYGQKTVENAHVAETCTRRVHADFEAKKRQVPATCRPHRHVFEGFPKRERSNHV